LFPLDADELTIGREGGCQIQLEDGSVSRQHCRLVRTADGSFQIEDLGSRNGTFVNGQRLDRSVPLHDGDKIQLSSTTILKFTYADRLDESFQRRMYESALRDGLTKAFNKKYFLDRLEREFRFAKRHQQPLALVMLDVDDMRGLNEGHGAAAGDTVLTELAAEIHALVRHEDVFARYGGEEFALICRATDAGGAAALAERIRAAVAGHAFAHGAESLSVSVSAGVAGLAADANDSMALLAAADEALAHAKRAGRNCVRVAGAP
jgi:diguanylate cyclase (GGDEF)-like protein